MPTRRARPVLPTATLAAGDGRDIQVGAILRRVVGEDLQAPVATTTADRPQRDGTQYDWDETGRLGPLPIEDPERVDERRRSVGLGPLEEDTRRIREETARAGELTPARPGRAAAAEAGLGALGGLARLVGPVVTRSVSYRTRITGRLGCWMITRNNTVAASVPPRFGPEE